MYKCFEEYSQFKYTYEELIGDHNSLEDYILDELLESFTNGCEEGGFALRFIITITNMLKILVFCKINAMVHLRLELIFTKKKIRMFCFVSQLYLKILGMSKNLINPLVTESPLLLGTAQRIETACYIGTIVYSITWRQAK